MTSHLKRVRLKINTTKEVKSNMLSGLKYAPNQYNQLLIRALNYGVKSADIRVLQYLIQQTSQNTDFKISPHRLFYMPSDYQFNLVGYSLPHLNRLFNLFVAMKILVLCPSPTKGNVFYKLNITNPRKLSKQSNLYHDACIHIFTYLYDHHVISSREFQISLYLTLMRHSTVPIHRSLDSVDPLIDLKPKFSGSNGHKEFFYILDKIGFLFSLGKYSKYNTSGKETISLNIYNIGSLYHHLLIADTSTTKLGGLLLDKLTSRYKYNPRYNSMDSLIQDIQQYRTEYKTK